jgi:6,7-dimethyl-8-ribityllumazine synthase
MRRVARLGIVVSEFNSRITEKMRKAALARAEERGAEVVEEASVTGAYDIPLVAKSLALRSDVDAVVCIGAVVKGDTDHDRTITDATAASLQRIALETMKPVALGVTGPGMTEKQARARIGYAAAAVDAALRSLETIRRVKRTK